MINPTFLYEGQGAAVTEIKAVTLYGTRKTTKLYGTVVKEDGGPLEHVCELNEPLVFSSDWVGLESAVTYTLLKGITATGACDPTSTYKRLHSIKVDTTAYRVFVRDPIHVVVITLTDGAWTITKDELTFTVDYIDGACYKDGSVGSVETPFPASITDTDNCGLTDSLFERCNNLLLETLQ